MDSKYYEEIGNFVENAKKKGGSLTDQNLLYVVKVATDIANKTGADFDMLLGEGIVAMKKAEEKYDPQKNDTFTKSAAVAIRGYMMNAINRQGNFVHIPVNHLQGFKKGQGKQDDAKVERVEIDSSNYDTLGSVDSEAFKDKRYDVLLSGLNTLDISGRIAMEMKLHLGKYAETIPNPKSDKLVYKYKNNMQSIADELDVPVNIASRIYKEAFERLSKYCQAKSDI